jgi:hypothetical protein
MRVTYLIEIEESRPEGDFEGNGVPAELKPMTAMQLQKAIAYDLVRIRTADLDPFASATAGVATYNPNAADNFHPPLAQHRPEFG